LRIETGMLSYNSLDLEVGKCKTDLEKKKEKEIPK